MEIVNEIINPSPVESLGPMTITVEFHTGDPPVTLKVFPFETIFNLKQRIAVKLGNTPLDHIFIAVEEPTKPDEYRPLEFTWLFNDGLLKDPLKAPKQPNSHLYQDGAKMVVLPSIEYGITLEDSNINETTKIHVWTLESISNQLQKTDPIFEGFIRLYFPQLVEWPKDDDETKIREEEELDKLTTYRQIIEEGLDNLNQKIELQNKLYKENKIIFPELIYVYVFKCVILDQTKKYNSASLELLFRDLQPNENRPFIRFFSGNDRIKPITKIGKKDDKFLISDKALLDSLMSDRPTMDMGAMIIIKRPVDDVSRDRKLLGLCWTFRIYDDGSAEFYFGTPRRGESVSVDILSKAQEIADGMLVGTDWYKKQFRLCDLSALYNFNYSETLNENKLADQINKLLLPMFYNEPKFIEDKQSLAVLRYKAVSNFVKTSDPMMNFLTMLTFNTQPNEPISYIDELQNEFGISEDDAQKVINQWERIHSEHVISYKTDKKGDLRIKDMVIRDSKSCIKLEDDDEDLTVAAYNDGISVRIYEYGVIIAGCRENTNAGIRNLRRILSLINLLFLSKGDEIKEPIKVETPNEQTIEDIEETYDPSLLLGMMGNEEEEQETTTEEMVQPEPIILKGTTSKGKPTIGPLSEQWILDRLTTRDKSLFGFEVTGDKRIKLYSRQCQKKYQPMVVREDAYNKIKNLYKSDNEYNNSEVRFLEVPLSDKKFENAYLIGNSTEDQRKARIEKLLKSGDIKKNKVILKLENEAKELKSGKKNKIVTLSKKIEVAEYEYYLLDKGFPLEGNTSITNNIKDNSSQNPSSNSNAKIKNHNYLEVLLKKYDDKEYNLDQLEKELNDYIIKLKTEIKTKIEKTKKDIPEWIVTKTGSNKRNINYYICTEYWCLYDDIPLVKSDFEKRGKCFKCQGTLIKDEYHPGEGETVIYRENAKYSGFLSKLQHPNQLALPCCFLENKHISIPKGAKNPITEDSQSENTDKNTLDKGSIPLRPFLETNKDYIPDQNILGRINKEWINLDTGKVAIPPPVINKFIGQNPDDFLTKSGPNKQGILSYLLPRKDEITPARAFIRYGIGNTTNIKNPGELLFSLISWARYAVDKSSTFESNPRYFKQILMKEMTEREQEYKNAFEQANFGTLVHEFSRRKDNGKDEINQAWERFIEYMKDDTELKELRLFESLFEVPGLFTATGFNLIRFVLRIDKDPVIDCPDFGILKNDRNTNLPFLFMLQVEVSPGQYTYDPLILYDGISLKEKNLYGALDISESTYFPNIDKILTTYSTKDGCGRYVNPINPWVLPKEEIKEEVKAVPSLSELISIREFTNVETKLLRDRSNRLVGIIKDGIYVPCADDGLILKKYKSININDIEFIFDLGKIIDFYKDIRGKSDDIFFNKIKPKKLLSENGKFTGLELNCGIIIPIYEKEAIKKNSYDLPFEEKPNWYRAWEEKSLIKGDSPLRFYTKEEELEEGYQHLRITLAEYLANENINLKKQIEGIQTRYLKNETLYSLQTELEAALKPHVEEWVILDERRNIKPYDLRRNCIGLKESECIEGCTWMNGKCMIHTNKPERYGNVDIIGLMTARLADELIRTFVLADEILNNKISRIIPVKGIIDSSSSLTFTDIDKSVRNLFEKRQPTKYTAGLTYPEERFLA